MQTLGAFLNYEYAEPGKGKSDNNNNNKRRRKSRIGKEITYLKLKIQCSL